MAELKNKSIIELRSIAQGLGVEILFSDTKEDLMQKIDSGLTVQLPPAPPPLPNVPSDIRLRTTPPAANSTPSEITDVLAAYIKRGLVVTFPAENQWHIRLARKEDSGTLRMPLRAIVKCADKLFQ